MKQAFRLFDKDNNGMVTTEEIGSVLRNLGLFPTEQELQQMLKEIDIDGFYYQKFNFNTSLNFKWFKGDGIFSFDEFVQLMYNMGNLAEISEEQEERELREAFKVIDYSSMIILSNSINFNKLKSVKKVFDKTGNGYITSSDLRSVLQCLGEQLTEDESNFKFKLKNRWNSFLNKNFKLMIW